MKEILKEATAVVVFVLTMVGILVTISYLGSTIVHKGKTIDLYLDQDIQSPKQLEDFAKQVNAATKDDTIIMHIAGFGGDAEAMFFLRNAILRTPATTIAEVEAPSYSAHAYLAVSAKYLEMGHSTSLMFHTGSGYGIGCATLVGGTEDRGHDAVPKCEQMTRNDEYIAKELIDSVDLLTLQEKKDLENGYDVYLTDKEVRIRQDNMANATVVPVVYDKPKALAPVLATVTITAKDIAPKLPIKGTK